MRGGVSVPAPCRTGKPPEGFSIDTAAISTAIFIFFCSHERSSSPSRLGAVLTIQLVKSGCIAKASIAELGLFVSNVFVCSVSGGERKLVSIGHELLVNPSLVVLDEPTSNSTSAFRLFSTPSALTLRKGCTV
ncbi:hypothetical protein QYE76_061589 [Lolium multiflorum]|uniref:ABC transporter domain-containing protein n=1 Tax=Lolium multiflorum TaxID=4521 RepID=A0AAD8S1B9_LOLMU|nr:hypothetical protein QYE76_061589 [Lolium multiflorum]